MIPSNSTPATSLARETNPRVFTQAIEGRWVENDGVHICLTQSVHATIKAVLAGESRPHAVTALSTLLDPEAPATKSSGITGGAKPGIIVAPELAIGASDWIAVDEAVRNCKRPRIVIVGCGHVSGQWIQDWLAAANGETSRLQGWPEGENELLTARPYNIGFAWIKTANTCQCIVFLKNFIDQGLEQGLVPNLGSGRFLLRLQAEDLILFPLICSEFHCALDTDQYPGSAARRIKRSLETSGPGARRILITGSAHTDEPGHPIWDRAFTHVFEHVHPAPLIAFVNGAEVVRGQEGFSCHVDSTVDLWRNRTGIYKPVPTGAERTRAQSWSTMPVRNASVDAVVARESFALALGGEARWVRSVTGGSYMWIAQARAVLNEDGTIADIDVGSAFSYEVLHASARRRKSQQPNPQWAASERSEEVAQYRTDSFRQKCSSCFTAALCSDVRVKGAVSTEHLGHGLLIGCDIDPSRVTKHKELLANGFMTTPFDQSLTNALDASLDAASVVWAQGAATLTDLPSCPKRTAFLAFDHCFLIWASPWLSFDAMRREMDNWRRADADGFSIVVVGRSKGGDFDVMLPAPALSRGDVAMPEGETGFHIPRENRVVSLYPIARLMEASKAEPNEEQSALKSRIDTMLARAFAADDGSAP